MERARTGLKKIMADALRQSASEEGPLLAWPLVCGPVVAGKTRAVDFKAGVLRVEAQDETWRRQLVDFTSSYLPALNQMVRERVQRIEFTVAPTANRH
jgi:hypothetical protein